MVLKRYWYVVLVLGVVCAASSVWFFIQGHTKSLSEYSESDLIAHWSERIMTAGVGAAYAEYLESKASVEAEEYHQGGHLFGRALYAHIGVEGLGICEWDKSSGCLHEVSGRAIEERGTASIQDVEKICEGQQGSRDFVCIHGIGHGLISALGYDEENLREALDVCENLARSDYAPRCFSGAFMEYNVRSFLTDASDPRALNEGATTPCEEFQGQRFLFCALWQPVWWHAASEKRGEALYVQMGEYCLGYAPRGERDVYACFAGIGLAATLDETFNIEGIRNLCEHATSEEQYQAYCRSEGALRSLGYARTISEETLFSVCDGLSGESYTSCRVRIEAAIEYERSL